MRNRNINGFNCGQAYNPKPNATMVVRMPQEHISWLGLDEVDLLELIKKLLTSKQKELDPNRTKFVYVKQPISYNELHQFLVFDFGKEFSKVPSKLNNLIFTEEIEGYILKKGNIGTKECIICIINDRELIPKEIGKILTVKGGKYKAMTYDSRELDAECESIEEARELLLKQPQFDADLNWRSKFHVAIKNFTSSCQIFRSLEAELDASEASSMNDLYLLPIKVIKELNDAFIKRRYRNNHGYDPNAEMTFDDFMRAVDRKDDGLLFSAKQLVGDKGIDNIYAKIDAAIQRSHDIHDGYGRNRGLVKSIHPAIIITCDKQEIHVSNPSELNDINVGCLIGFERGPDSMARNIKYIQDEMRGADNYVDIIAARQKYHFPHPRQYIAKNRRRARKLDKFTIKGIIEEELKLSDGVFDMHKLPHIVEATLDIQWDPKKFGFPTLRSIFEDYEIKKICRLDNASSTALVSTIEKSKEIPTMEFIKRGFEKVLIRYGDPNRGYRMKKRGSKKTDIRAHFAQLTGKALKPKAWFNINVKDLIRKCDDIIDIDYDTEPDGVWLLFLKKQRQYH